MSDFIDSKGPAFLGLQAYYMLKLIDEQGNEMLENLGPPTLPPSRLSSSLLALQEKGPLALVDLARLLNMPHQLAAQRIALMKTMELIDETPDPGDGRRVLLSLNETGTEMALAVAAASAATSEVFRGIFDEIGIDLFDAILQFRQALDQQSLSDRLAERAKRKVAAP